MQKIGYDTVEPFQEKYGTVLSNRKLLKFNCGQVKKLRVIISLTVFVHKAAADKKIFLFKIF